MTSKLERVREIILNQFYEASEQRIADLEGKLADGFADIQRQLDESKKQMEKDATALKLRLEKDQAEREALGHRLQQLSEALLKNETRLSRELAMMEKALRQFSLKDDASTSVLKKSVTEEISKMGSKMAAEQLILKNRLSSLFREELADASLATTRDLEHKQKAFFDKIDTGMKKLQKEIDAAKEFQKKN